MVRQFSPRITKEDTLPVDGSSQRELHTGKTILEIGCSVLTGFSDGLVSSLKSSERVSECTGVNISGSEVSIVENSTSAPLDGEEVPASSLNDEKSKLHPDNSTLLADDQRQETSTQRISRWMDAVSYEEFKSAIVWQSHLSKKWLSGLFRKKRKTKDGYYDPHVARFTESTKL